MKGMIRHFESTQSNKFAMSLQYLIKEVMEFIMEFIKIKTSTSWIIDFWWKPDMSKIPKKGSLLRFCNIYICIYNIYILRKSIVTVFVFYCDAKHSDTLQGSSHICCHLVLQTLQQSQFLSWCPGLNQFVLVFIFVIKRNFIFT